MAKWTREEALAYLKQFSPAQYGQILKEVNRELAERQLSQFLKQCWPVIDPAPFVDGWHLHAVAEHLEAVSAGQIRRLLINLPPRHCKSNLVSVAWPAWTWIKKRGGLMLTGPQIKFLCLTYAHNFALDHARLMRKLVTSPWYQANWGHIVKLSADQEAKEFFENTAGGQRLSGGIDGAVTGRGGDIKIIDDPHKVKEVESEIVRQGVLKTYDETLRNRVTDPKKSAEVIVMQRIAEDDLSGHVISQESDDLVHLMLPAEFESDRKCVTYFGSEFGWEDPRTHGGEILWPEQWGERELAPFKTNSYQWAGQYQQSPVPRGGGIFKRRWWQLYPPEGEQFDALGKPLNKLVFPPMEYIVASLDTACTTKEENDYSALVVMGIWRDTTQKFAERDGRRVVLQSEDGMPKIMLMDAWKEKLEFHELVEKVIKTCKTRKVDRLLIEAKNVGQSVAQEIARLCAGLDFGVSIIDPKRQDKVARANSIQHIFENGLVYAPDRTYAQPVLDEMSVFPKGRHDDMVDAVVYALKHLRDMSMIQTPTEFASEAIERSTFKPKKETAYDRYFGDAA